MGIAYRSRPSDNRADRIPRDAWSLTQDRSYGDSRGLRRPEGRLDGPLSRHPNPSGSPYPPALPRSLIPSWCAWANACAWLRDWHQRTLKTARWQPTIKPLSSLSQRLFWISCGWDVGGSCRCGGRDGRMRECRVCGCCSSGLLSWLE